MKKTFYRIKNRKNMDINKKQIESSIIKDEKLSLYKIVLPGITMYYENIFFSFNGMKKIYGESDKKIIDDGFNSTNILVGISDFYNFTVVCIINLEDLSSNYFFINTGDFLNFKILDKDYFCFIYKDYKGDVGFYTDLDLDDFILELKDKEIIIKNNIFGTKVFKKSVKHIYDYKQGKLNIFLDDTKQSYLDVADFYIFDDYFYDLNGYKNLYNFLNLFSEDTIKIDKNLLVKLKLEKYEELFFPKIKINLSIFTKNIKNFNFVEFRKLLLCFSSENTLSYIINNNYIKKYFFVYFKDISSYIIDEIDIDFDLPKNIFLGDVKLQNFKDNLLILRYNYFKLKESLNSIKKLQNIKYEDSENTDIVKIRGNITKQNLNKTLKIYENKLKELFIYIDKMDS